MSRTICRTIYQSGKLQFTGVADGHDVYNCSVPFIFNGQKYIFGRVEPHTEWANSYTYLFRCTGGNSYEVVPDSRQYQLEDPFIALIGGELVLGGTHVAKICGEVDTVYSYFYRGKDVKNLQYYTRGPRGMKDVRLVELADGRVGVFSRPRNQKILAEYGTESMIGFAVVESLEKLTPEVIENAPYIHGIFENQQWGGVNQAYLLDSGRIGVIGHMSDKLTAADGTEILSYKNLAFVFDPATHRAEHVTIIAVRGDYPAGPAKLPNLVDCAFTSGIELREDGRVNLYSGIGDCEEGVVTIDYPFPGETVAGKLELTV